jgi:hypothetical protein
MAAGEYGLNGAISIKRKPAIEATPMTLADVDMKPHPEYGLPLFHCKTLLANLTPASCAANYGNAAQGEGCHSCHGCAVGSYHRQLATSPAKADCHARKEAERREKARSALGLACIRCGKSNKTATRLVGRMRLHDHHSICTSCFNRQREVVTGLNSKGVAPKKHAHLKPATVVIINERDLSETLDIGLRSSRSECERYVERALKGTALLTVLIDGKVVMPGAPESPLYRHISESVSRPEPRHTANCVTHRAIDGKLLGLPVACDRKAAEAVEDELQIGIAHQYKAAKADRVPMSFRKMHARTTWLPAMSYEEDAEYRRWLEDNDDTPSCKPVNIGTPDRATQGQEYSNDSPDMYPLSGLDEIRDFWGSTEELVRFLLDDPAVAQPVTDDFDANLTWAGKTLAQWSTSTGTPVGTLARRMVETGTPFPSAPKAIRRAPAHCEPTVESKPIAESGASADSAQPVMEPVREPNDGGRWESDGGMSTTPSLLVPLLHKTAIPAPTERAAVPTPKRERKSKAVHRSEPNAQTKKKPGNLNTVATPAAVGSRALMIAFRLGVADIVAPKRTS